MLTETDIGKPFLLDNTLSVVLVAIEKAGWTKVRYNGSLIPAHLTRLSEPNTLNKILAVLEDKPVITKVEVTWQTPQGSEVHTLEGPDARTWQVFVNLVSVFADSHGANPEFHKLRWRKS